MIAAYEKQLDAEHNVEGATVAIEQLKKFWPASPCMVTVHFERPSSYADLTALDNRPPEWKKKHFFVSANSILSGKTPLLQRVIELI